MSILDSLDVSSKFECSTIASFVAFQIASRLQDIENFPVYLAATRRHSTDELFSVLNLAAKTQGDDPVAIKIRKSILNHLV
jgi:hypothetical protein